MYVCMYLTACINQRTAERHGLARGVCKHACIGVVDVALHVSDAVAAATHSSNASPLYDYYAYPP